LAPSIRVLVVDDYEPFRRFVRSTLQARPELQVVAEAADGLEAVRKAEELQPDLILLDIALPKQNGIQAAFRIQQVSPKSKILFCSANRSWDIAEEALRTGAYGYVAKSSAGSELLLAIEEVLQGNQFVTTSLVGRDLIDWKHEHVADRNSKESVAPLAPVNIEILHEVAFYSEDKGLVDRFAQLTEAALEVGNAVILIANEPHRTAVLEKLKQDRVNIDAPLKQGRYIALDVGETLSKVMVAGRPDPDRCATLMGDLIVEAAKHAK